MLFRKSGKVCKSPATLETVTLVFSIRKVATKGIVYGGGKKEKINVIDEYNNIV